MNQKHPSSEIPGYRPAEQHVDSCNSIEGEKLLKIYRSDAFTVRIYASEGDISKMTVGPADKAKCAFCNRSVTDHVFMELETVDKETKED